MDADGTHPLTILDSWDALYTIALDGHRITRITELTAEGGEFHQPSWSPDGTRLAFVSDRDGNKEIYVMNADGSHPVRPTRNQASDWGPSWSAW